MKHYSDSRFLSILDRYIIKDFVLHFLLITLSLAALYIIVDFFQRIRMFLSNDATVYHMFLYFLYSTPMILVQMIPISVLLSSLITFGILSKNCELVAMKASGVSLYRVSVAPIFFSVLIAVAAFLISETIMPRSNQLVKKTVYIDIQNRPQMGEFKHRELWYRGQAGIYNFSLFDPTTVTLKGVRINNIDGEMNLVRSIDAAKGRWNEESKAWTLYDVLVATFPDNDFPVVETMKSYTADIPEKPEDFLVVQREPNEMGFAELRKYITKIRSEGYDATRYTVDMHGKVAFPFVCIIMAIVGVCFASRSERSGGIAQGIGVGIITGLSYWLIFAFTISLGYAGSLPPPVAAWAANLLFLVAALLMLSRMRT